MLIWQELLLSQASMDRGERALVVVGSRGGLDVGDQLWDIFVAGLGERHALLAVFAVHPLPIP